MSLSKVHETPRRFVLEFALTPTLALTLALTLAAGLAACAADPGSPADAGPVDSGLAADAAPSDAAVSDAELDAGVPADSGLLDAAPGDAAPADAGAPDSGAGDTGCATPVTLTAVQTAIFSGCSGHGPMTCHSREPFQGDLDLTEGHSWAALVNAPSAKSPLPRVAPGDLEGSFLWRKLKNELPQDGSEGDPMPKGEAIQWRELPAEEMDLVRCWILGGALDD